MGHHTLVNDAPPPALSDWGHNSPENSVLGGLYSLAIFVWDTEFTTAVNTVPRDKPRGDATHYGTVYSN